MGGSLRASDPWHRDARQCGKVELGVDGGRLEALVAEQVGNLAEACAAVNQPARCRVAEHMGAAEPTKRNPSAPQVTLDHVRDRGGITEAAGRVVDADEYAAAQARRSLQLNVVCKRRPHIPR